MHRSKAASIYPLRDIHLVWRAMRRACAIPPLRVPPQQRLTRRFDVLARASDQAPSSQVRATPRRTTHMYDTSTAAVQVKDMEKMRRDMPEGASMRVAKNRLLRVAIDGMEEDDKARWQGLVGQKGMNAYVFVKEDAIRGAVKAYGTLYAELKVCLQPRLQQRKPRSIPDQ